MLAFLKGLFRRGKKGPKRISTCFRTINQRRDCGLCSLKYVCDDPGRDDIPKKTAEDNTMTDTWANHSADWNINPGIGRVTVARQGGQQRNRIHIYDYPFGYPIRICDWVAVALEDIEPTKTSPPPEEPYAAVTCRHCMAIVEGKRQSPGGPPEGY